MNTLGRPPRNPLEEYFVGNPGRLIHKWHHYFEIYHRHFERFRGRAPVVLEIGVQHGGSLQMWREYFGEGAAIIGVDVIPQCAAFEERQISVIIGDQADRRFLTRLRTRLPHIDILIDDGGHTMEQQIATFEELYPHIQPEGVYLCEDLHTSYWPDFGGGLRRPGTFIEYSKAFIDRLHAWYLPGADAVADGFTLGTYSLHYYDSVLVVEKRRMQAPVNSQTGVPGLVPAGRPG